MADDDLILAELLCARLVHDLSGPVGAVANGAELLEEGLEDSGGTGASGEIAGEAVTLLVSSAAVAIARLRFLRLALGAPIATSGPVAELRKLAADYFTRTASGPEAVALDWPTSLDAGLAAIPVRVLCNLLLLARDCLPRGGTIRLAEPAGGAVLTLIAEQVHAAPGEAAKALAAPGAAGLTVRGAQGYLAKRLAQQAGMAIVLAAQPGRIAITLKKA